jgi:hypothetical protein
MKLLKRLFLAMVKLDEAALHPNLCMGS